MNFSVTKNPQAAQAPIHDRASPLSSILQLARCLERIAHGPQRVSVVRANDPQATSVSAWALRLRDQPDVEKPLLYLLSAATSAQLVALSSESRQRGVFCNDIETRTSRWPKGVQPCAPLWLTANRLCTPFDPASGAEARAITLHALQALYTEGQPGFYYLALHDEQGKAADESGDHWHGDAFKGMYRCAEPSQAEPPAPQSSLSVRLLGAGRLLREVQHAAQLLSDDWGVAAQVWSCPSYTRLARDAETAQRWNRLHPMQPARLAHVQRCLDGCPDPVIAITGYRQHVAEQLAGFVGARFVAVGSEAFDGAAHERHWIVLLALKALVDEGRLPPATQHLAMQRYALA